MYRNTPRPALILTLLAACLLGACAQPGAGGTRYAEAETHSAQTVQPATVVSLQPVRIAGRYSRVGKVTGSVAGAMLVENVGKGTGNKLATVAAVVTGGILGRRAEAALTEWSAHEITVSLADGSLLSIVQVLEDDMAGLGVGAQVRVLSGPERLRVVY